MKTPLAIKIPVRIGRATRLSSPGIAALCLAAGLVAPLPDGVNWNSRVQACVTASTPAERIADGLPDPENAALLYWICWSTGFDTFGDGSQYQPEPDWKPSAEYAKTLTENQGVIRQLLRATRIRECDWGVEYSQGFGALMPHLGKLRAATRVLAADSRRLAADGKVEDAAERVAAIFRMARHAAQDPVLISSLVGLAIHNAGKAELEWLATNGHLSDAGRKNIGDAVEQIPASDPFRFHDAIKMERDIALEWIKKEFTGPAAGRRFLEQFAMPANDDDAAAAEVGKYNAEQLAEGVDMMRPAYDEAIAAWGKPDAVERLRAIEGRVNSGEFGPVAKLMFPALNRSHEAYERGIKDAMMVREMVGAR